jgi:N-acetylglutamate synthase-like GNAT family acetyltransferase
MSDLAAVAALLGDFQLPTDDLASAPDLRLWVVADDSSLVGVIGLERADTNALLRSLAVAPRHQKLGLGRRLVAEVETAARSEGVVQLVLLTETAVAFFRANGYQVTDRRSIPEGIRQTAEFRSLCPASAVCMTKSLPA